MTIIITITTITMKVILTTITWEGGLGLGGISQEGSRRRELSPRCFVLVAIIIAMTIMNNGDDDDVHTDTTRVDLQSVEGLPHPK